jgi:hypothetical protein
VTPLDLATLADPELDRDRIDPGDLAGHELGSPRTRREEIELAASRTAEAPVIPPYRRPEWSRSAKLGLESLTPAADATLARRHRELANGPHARIDRLAEILDALVAHLRRFVWFPRPEQADAVALWVAHTHALDAVEQSPILVVASPVKQSGKSRLLDVIETVVPTPWRIERPSEAVLYRRIARDRPTILMDEADTIFEDRKGQYEGIRAVFNAGNRRGTVVSRVMPKGKTFELVDFPIFAAKAVAGLGRFPETIVDRSVVIAMTRRVPGEPIERLRARRAAALGEPIRDALAEVLGDPVNLTLPDYELPTELDDRAQDNWEGLIALANLAGGHWPELARTAAIVLNRDRATADDNAGVTLLADLRVIFEETGETFLTTSMLLERLHTFDSSPWSEWRGGKPLSPRGMAAILHPFGIEPEKVREGQLTIRGYSRHAFSDAWSRFTPSMSATPATSATPSTFAVSLVALVADAQQANGGETDLTVAALTVFGDDFVPAAALAAPEERERREGGAR